MSTPIDTSPNPDAPDAGTTATTTGARDHARSQAGLKADAMPTVPASAATDLPVGITPAAVVWDETVAGGGYTSRLVAAGTHVRLTDLEGDACAHLAIFHGLDPWERLNVADTVKVQWQAYLGPGAVLLSDQGRALATIVEDTSATHDALCGTSTRADNIERFGAGSPESPSPSGRDLFTLALAKHGLEPRDLPPTVALCKGATVAVNGDVHYTPGVGPGGHVVLRAELPLVIAIANVPHVLDQRLDYTVTGLRVTAWTGSPTGPDDPQWSSTPERERAYLNTADHAVARGLR